MFKYLRNYFYQKQIKFIGTGFKIRGLVLLLVLVIRGEIYCFIVFCLSNVYDCFNYFAGIVSVTLVFN